MGRYLPILILLVLGLLVPGDATAQVVSYFTDLVTEPETSIAALLPQVSERDEDGQVPDDAVRALAARTPPIRMVRTVTLDAVP